LHELQIASELIQTVVSAAKGYEGVIRVEEVHLSIGRMTFIGREQLAFCWEAVSGERDLIKGSSLIITEEEVVVECSSCGYRGGLDDRSDPIYHYMLPVFACPRCGLDVDIIKGKGVTITNIKLLIDEEEAGT